jgi:hypothetical protein
MLFLYIFFLTGCNFLSTFAVILTGVIKKILVFVFLFSAVLSKSAVIKGVIIDQNNEPVPYVSVYIKNTTFGVSSNLKGEYFLETKAGNYTLVFSSIGYETQEHQVNTLKSSPVILNIVFKEAANELGPLTIYSDKRDIAKEIMGKVRDKRKDYLNAVKNYSCLTYQKISLEKECRNCDSVASVFNDSTSKEKKKKVIINKKKKKQQDSVINARNLQEHIKEQKLNFIESLSEIHYDPPGKYKEVVIAHHDYAETKPPPEGTINFGFTIGGDDIAPVTYASENPYILISDVQSADFNFYQNLIEAPALTDKQLMSPIGASSGLNYFYDLDAEFYENGKKIYKIAVKPVYKHEALFTGFIFIEDSTWALLSVELSINPTSLLFCKEFKIIQNYSEIEKGMYLPSRREFYYTIKEGGFNYIGATRVDHSKYEINKVFPPKFFSSEVKRYNDDAFDKDSIYWDSIRPLTLKQNEVDFINETDSLRKYYSSEEFLMSQDSSYNDLTIWNFILTGVGHRNRYRKSEFFFAPLIGQLVPLGIGGYRHRLTGIYKKEFKNAMLMETDGMVDYGFNNKDLKGKMGIGLTYVPKKFVRTYITVGDYYDMINTYASIGSIFSRSNYVRTKTFAIAQRMEIINGLFAELTFDFSDQLPINNMQMDSWSGQVFDSAVNAPISFTRYIKSEIKLELKYRIRQKYMIKGGKKIIMGSKWPEISFIYRKGIPGLFNSEVDFDYIEAGSKHEIKMARLGSGNWNVQLGSFLNKTNLRIIEYKYFRGSDPFFFSDPTKSFQLLGPTLSTNSAYLRANYIQHFDGVLLNKIPVLNRLKITLAAGAGTLIIPDQNMAHFEMFGGIERIIRIKKQLFRLGIYAVTADNTIEAAKFEPKIGISFYNTFTKKWEY